ncbi:MAG: GtrA family protein, partial [Sulfurovum sp.]
QFIKDRIVGVLSVIIDYILLYTSYSIVEFNSNISVSIGFFGSAVFNFLMHRFYTFSETKESSHSKAFLKYLLLIFGSYFITLALVNLLIHLSLNIYIAKLITVSIVYIYGFIIGKFFVFK